MSTYHATARSNYVRVEDENDFRRAVEPFGLEVIVDAEGRVGLLATGGDGFNWYYYDEAEDDVDCDPVTLLAPHLADGEVMILVESGAEKYRYVSGYAIAFNNKGEHERVHLNDIYDRAKRLGSGISDAIG